MIKFLVCIILGISSVSFAQGVSSNEFPVSWDWRNVNGQNWMTPVRAQEGCGSCVVFGMASTLEAQLKIDSNIPWWNPVISVQALFGCGGGECGSGWLMESAIKYAQTNGLLDENCSPYTGTSGPNSCNLCADEKNRRYYFQTVTPVTTGKPDVYALKKALMRGPVWSEMILYSDFMLFGGWGVYRHNPATGPVIGSHTIAMIGWDDTKKAWIVKNSWGTAWGNKGYGYVHYDDTSGLGNKSYAFTFSKNESYIALQNINDGETLKTDTTVHVITDNPDINHLEFWIESSDRTSKKMLAATDSNTADFTLHVSDLPAEKNNIWVVASSKIADLSGRTSFESWRIQILKPTP